MPTASGLSRSALLPSAALATTLATGLMVSHALAAPNQTPNTEGNSMTCRCACMTIGGGYGGDKRISWTGTRGDCQALSGTACRLDKPDSQGNSYGSSTGCDIILIRTQPKDQIRNFRRPDKLQSQ